MDTSNQNGIQVHRFSGGQRRPYPPRAETAGGVGEGEGDCVRIGLAYLRIAFASKKKKIDAAIAYLNPLLFLFFSIICPILPSSLFTIMGSGSPPSKPSAIPSHMLNGGSPLHTSTGSGSGTRVRDARERESLNTSIRSSFAPRVPAGFDSLGETETDSAGNAGPAADNTENTTNEPTPAHSAMTLRYVDDLEDPFLLGSNGLTAADSH